MLLNYLKTTFRIFLQNKLYYLINIVGLSTGLTCFILIQLFVFDELSYDKHFSNAENICRMAIKGDMSGFSFEAAVMGGPVGPLMEDEIPEIIKCTRFYKVPRPVLFTWDEKKFYEDNVLYADSAVFDVFDFELLKGDPQTALIPPNSLILTETTAYKYFGDEDPIGKFITWNNLDKYTVTGVLKDPVKNTHMHFDVLASYSTLLTSGPNPEYFKTLFAFMVFNYIVLDDDADIDKVEKKIATVVEKHMGEGMEDTGSKFEIFIQPVTDIHLFSHLVHEMETNSNISSVYIFSAIAILILIIGCINFVNLSTAFSSQRALEVGLRKVVGANRKMLIRQFILESLFITFFSMVIAMFLAWALLPVINNLSAKQFSFDLFRGWQFVLFSLMLVFSVGFIAGIYPALYMSAFRPVKVLKGIFARGSKRSVFRNLMVIIQFVISIFLICCTFIIYQQLYLFNNKDIGIEKNNLIVIPVRGQTSRQYETIKEELKTIPGIEDISASSSYLGNFQQRRGYFIEGFSRNDMWMILNLQVDYNYLEMMNVDFIDGRNFIEQSIADSSSVIINEALVKKADWKEPIGKYVYMPATGKEIRYKVIGVVDNFNYASLHEDVKPILITINPDNFRYISVKINPSDERKILAKITAKWEKMFPDNPFDYFFQEDKVDELYGAEVKMGQLFIYFTFLAIFIASLGVFGVVLFGTGQRKKEIGIRKVFGESVPGILRLLLKDFVVWVLLACIIAWPLSWIFANNWLMNFEYKTELRWWIFLISGLIGLLINILTISYQALVAARANPTDSLRYE